MGQEYRGAARSPVLCHSWREGTGNSAIKPSDTPHPHPTLPPPKKEKKIFSGKMVISVPQLLTNLSLTMQNKADWTESNFGI